MTTAYVSSTYEDLRECRDKVALALRQLGLNDVAMESYVAEPRRPLEQCLADIRRSDIYIGVIAWRYGYIPPGYEQSITELEYLAATEAGKPRLMFMLDEDAPWPRRYVDRDGDRIERLRTLIAQDLLVSSFTDASDLALKVTASLSRLVSTPQPQHEPDGLDAEVRGLYLERLRLRYVRVDLGPLTPSHDSSDLDVGLMSLFVDPSVARENGS